MSSTSQDHILRPSSSTSATNRSEQRFDHRARYVTDLPSQQSRHINSRSPLTDEHHQQNAYSSGSIQQQQAMSSTSPRLVHPPPPHLAGPSGESQTRTATSADRSTAIALQSPPQKPTRATPAVVPAWHSSSSGPHSGSAIAPTGGNVGSPEQFAFGSGAPYPPRQQLPPFHSGSNVPNFAPGLPTPHSSLPTQQPIQSSGGYTRNNDYNATSLVGGYHQTSYSRSDKHDPQPLHSQQHQYQDPYHRPVFPSRSPSPSGSGANRNKCLCKDCDLTVSGQHGSMDPALRWSSHHRAPSDGNNQVLEGDEMKQSDYYDSLGRGPGGDGTSFANPVPTGPRRGGPEQWPENQRAGGRMQHPMMQQTTDHHHQLHSRRPSQMQVHQASEHGGQVQHYGPPAPQHHGYPNDPHPSWSGSHPNALQGQMPYRHDHQAYPPASGSNIGWQLPPPPHHGHVSQMPPPPPPMLATSPGTNFSVPPEVLPTPSSPLSSSPGGTKPVKHKSRKTWTEVEWKKLVDLAERSKRGNPDNDIDWDFVTAGFGGRRCRQGILTVAAKRGLKVSTREARTIGKAALGGSARGRSTPTDLDDSPMNMGESSATGGDGRLGSV
ncbi:hypothetical protein FRC03_007957 [Tulasnella sp. 419]|nr:hypothetical protein FRC03_007957 [Tulasnella sp. 419]